MKDFSYPVFNIFDFMGTKNNDYKKSNVIIVPVPYALNSLSGQIDGPLAIIESSDWVEFYDQETQKDFFNVGIMTLPPLDCIDILPKDMVNEVSEIVAKIIGDKKFPILLGGEHTISVGATMGLKGLSNISVLQLDAHTDLYSDFEGEKHHKGCVARRMIDNSMHVVQAGIRTTTKEEVDFIKKKNIDTFFYNGKLEIDKIIERLHENVYLNIDLDVLDPSIMPAVGTPEAGGITWFEILELIKRLSKERNIIGADLVELDPIADFTAPNILAARLAYKIISYVYD